MIVTNIITEVIKKVTWDKIPTNLLVVLIAELLTFGIGIAYAQIYEYAIMWYHIAGAAVVGVFVSYAAMFGFDKFRQAIEQFTNK
jgi:hypothetical protein